MKAVGAMVGLLIGFPCGAIGLEILCVTLWGGDEPDGPAIFGLIMGCWPGGIGGMLLGWWVGSKIEAREQ